MALFIMIAASLKLNAQTTIRLPIEFAKLGNGECIVVKGLGLNGLNLNFIFDTGGSSSGIDQETIDALGLKPDTTITAKGAGGEMKIAHFGKRDLKTGDGNVSINLSLFPLPPSVLKDSTKTNGLLGLGSLTGYHVGINFDDMVERPVVLTITGHCKLTTSMIESAPKSPINWILSGVEGCKHLIISTLRLRSVSGFPLKCLFGAGS